MKRRNLILAILPILLSMVVFQGCKKDNTTFKIYQSFTTPTITAPVNASTVKITGTTVDLKWVSADQDGDTPTATVYFGTSSVGTPVYKTGVTGNTLTVPVEVGKTYYWKVTMVDANKVMTYGPMWSFYVFDPIAIFTGTFKADEPAEAYSYDVTFAKVTNSTIITHNYWNSGWDATFTLNLTANTYAMPLTTWGNYSAIESGTINQTTGTMVGNYTIYYKGGVEEVGVHTYTKK